MYLKKTTQLFWFRQIALILAIALPLTQLAPYAEAYSPSIPGFSSPILPFNIPAELGYVTQSFQSKNGKFIIHLQDAHGSISAQRQLAAIVEYLHEEFDIQLLLLEGAEGELAMDEARQFPDEEIRERTGRKFLEKFELTGPEYYVISDNPKMEVYGLERMKNYYTNREDYLAARRLSLTNLRHAGELELLFQNIRRENANKELQAFYREEEISEKTGVFSMTRLTSLAETYQAKQKHLDFKQFFPSLASMLGEEQSLSIKSEKVLEEYTFLESTVKELLFKTEEEKRVDQWLEKAGLIRKLFALRLSSDDYRPFLKDRTGFNEESFRAFVGSVKREKAWKQEYDSIFKSLPVFLRFYEGAHARDVEMAKKTERWLRKKRQKTAIAVTGGFHTAGYTAALREAGFGCLVIQPKLSEIKENDQEKYHRAAERDLSRAFGRSQIVELEPIAGFGSGERYQRLLYEMAAAAKIKTNERTPKTEVKAIDQPISSVGKGFGILERLKAQMRWKLNDAERKIVDDELQFFRENMFLPDESDAVRSRFEKLGHRIYPHTFAGFLLQLKMLSFPLGFLAASMQLVALINLFVSRFSKDSVGLAVFCVVFFSGVVLSSLVHLYSLTKAGLLGSLSILPPNSITINVDATKNPIIYRKVVDHELVHGFFRLVLASNTMDAVAVLRAMEKENLLDHRYQGNDSFLTDISKLFWEGRENVQDVVEQSRTYGRGVRGIGELVSIFASRDHKEQGKIFEIDETRLASHKLSGAVYEQITRDGLPLKAAYRMLSYMAHGSQFEEAFEKAKRDFTPAFEISAKPSSGFGSPSDEILRFLEQFTHYVFSVSSQNRSRNVLMNHALKTVPGGAGRYFERFFTWRAQKWKMTLDEYAQFIQGDLGEITLNEWRDELSTVNQKIWGFQFVSGASQTYHFQSRELETIQQRWRELLSRKDHEGDRNVKVRIVGIGLEPYELEIVFKLWMDVWSEVKKPREWNITFEIYGIDAKEFMLVEELLTRRKFESLRKNVELHWMDITDAEQVDGMWGGEPADIIFIRHTLRQSISEYPELQKVLARPDVWAPGGLMITDREMGRILTDPKRHLGVQLMDGQDVDVFNTTWILGNQPVGFGATEETAIELFSPEISETSDPEEIMLEVVEKIQSADKPLQVQLSPKTFKQRIAFLNYGFWEIEITQQEMRRQILELFKNGAVKSVTESSHDNREFTLRTNSGIFLLHASQEMNGSNFRYLKERKGWRVFTSAHRPENTTDASALEFVLAHFESPTLTLGIPTKSEKEAVLGALFGTEKETFNAVLLSVEEIREREEELTQIRKREAEKERLRVKESPKIDLLEPEQPASVAERMRSIFIPLSERTLIAPTVFLEALNEVLGNGHHELAKFTVTIGQIEKIRDFLSARARVGVDEKAKEIYDLLFQNPSELELVRKEFESFSKETFGRFIISENTVLRSPEEAMETFLEAALIEASFDSKLGERQLAGFTLRFLNDNYQSIYRFLKAGDAITSNDIARFFPLLFPINLDPAEAESAKIFYDVLGVERIQPAGRWHFPHQIVAKYSKIDLAGTQGIPELIAYLKKAPQKPVVVLAFDMLIRKFRKQAVENFKKISERFFAQYRKRLEEWGGAAEFRKQYFAVFNLTEKKFAYLTGDENALVGAERDLSKIPVHITRQADSVEVNLEVKIETFPIKDIERFISELSSVSDADVLRYAEFKRETVTIIPWLDGQSKLLALQDAERYAKENDVVLKVGHWFYRFEDSGIIVTDKAGHEVGRTQDPNLRIFLLIRLHGVIQYLAKSILENGPLPDRKLKQGLSPSPVRYRVEFHPDSLTVHFGPNVQAKLSADGKVKGTQQGSPIPESEALKEQVIASGLTALALLQAAQRNAKDPLLSVPTYEELLGAIPTIFAQSGFGHAQTTLPPLSEEEIVNWWETGFIDGKNISLPPDRQIQGRIVRIPEVKAKKTTENGRKIEHRVAKNQTHWVYRMESWLDPNRGVVLTLYRKPNNQKAKSFKPWMHYQWLPEFKRPVEINLAAWDLWDFHEGKPVVAVEDRYFEAYIIKQQREGKAEQFSVRATLFTEPGKQKTMTITPHDGFTFGKKDLREPIAIALENDPDHGLVANAYWKKDYEKGIKKRWGKEIGSAVYDRGRKNNQYHSVDLNRLSVINVLKGAENVKPGRYTQVQILSVDESGKEIVKIFYSSTEKGGAVEKEITLGIPPRSMRAHKLKVGSRLFLRVEEDMNHGLYVGVYRSTRNFGKLKLGALVKFKYLKYRSKPRKVKGRPATVKFGLLDVFSVKDLEKRKSLKPGRGVRVKASKLSLLTKGYARLILYTAHASTPQFSIIIPPDKKQMIEEAKARNSEVEIKITVKENAYYGVYLEVTVEGKLVGYYTVLGDSDRLRLVDFDLMRIVDWFSDHRVNGKAVDVKGVFYKPKNTASNLGNIAIKFDNRALKVQHPAFKNIMPFLEFESDVIYGSLLKIYDTDGKGGKRNLLATYRKSSAPQKRKRLIPVTETTGDYIARLVRAKTEERPNLYKKNGLTIDDIIDMAVYQVEERAAKSGKMDQEHVEMAVREFMRLVLDYMITGRDAGRIRSILRETRLARSGASADDLDGVTQSAQPAKTEKAGFGAEGKVLPTVKIGDTEEHLIGFQRDASGRIAKPMVSRFPLIVTDRGTNLAAKVAGNSRLKQLFRRPFETSGKNARMTDILNTVLNLTYALSNPNHNSEIDLIEMQIVPLAWEKRAAGIQLSEDWSYLPDDLRVKFENGFIPVTIPKPPDLKTVDYFVLFPTNYGLQGVQDGSYYGRSGLILKRMEGDRLMPIIAEINGKEFLLRIKGQGTPTGGYGEWIEIAGQKRLRGAAEREEAEFEFISLELRRKSLRFGEGNTPRAVGNVYFKGDEVDQAIHLAWTPTDNRGHWRINPALPEFTMKDVSNMAFHFGQEFGELLSLEIPLLPWRSASSDNLVSTGHGEWAFTDYATILPLFMEDQITMHRWVSGQFSLAHNMWMGNSPGSEASRASFLKGLGEVFVREKKFTPEQVSEMVKLGSLEALLSFLGDQFLDEQIFKNRLKYGFDPAEFIDQITKLVQHVKSLDAPRNFDTAQFHEVWFSVQGEIHRKPELLDSKENFLRAVLKQELWGFFTAERHFLGKIAGKEYTLHPSFIKNASLRKKAADLHARHPLKKSVIISDEEADAIAENPEEGIKAVVGKILGYPDIRYPKAGRTKRISSGFGAENKSLFTSEKEAVNERLERHNDEDELKKVVRDDVLNVLEKITKSGEKELGVEPDNVDENFGGGLSTLEGEDSGGSGIMDLTTDADLDEFRDMLGDVGEDNDSADLDPKQEQTLLQAMRGAVEHIRTESYFAAYTVITQLFHPNLEADIKYLKSKDPEAWTAFEYLFRLALGEPLLEEQRSAVAENAVIDLGLLISRSNALDKVKGVWVSTKRFIRREGSAALSPNTRDIQGIYAYVNTLAKDHRKIFDIFDRYGIYDPVWQNQILDRVLRARTGFGFVVKQEKTLFVKGAAGFGIIEAAAQKRAFRFAFPKNIRVVFLDDETNDPNLTQAKRAAVAVGKALKLKREQVWIDSALDVTAEDWLLNREIIYVGFGSIDRRFAKNVVENNEGWNAFFEMLLRSEKLLAQAA